MLVACDDAGEAIRGPEVMTHAEAADLPPEGMPRIVLPSPSEGASAIGAVEAVPALGGVVFESAVTLGE
ncbi:MAG: hypothetical protein GEU80_06780 [Dehalococcoidia bacterium]|nr:hypothetical protein [Dehalococcoidia bacterium]